MNLQPAPTQDELNRQLIDALENNDVETALVLVNAGADPNTRYFPTRKHSFKHLIDYLFRNGASPHKHKDTALMFVCGRAWMLMYDGPSPSLLLEEFLPLVESMLIHGADVDARTKENETALHFAVSKARWHTVELLLQYGANVNAQDKEGCTPLIWATLSMKASDMARLLLSHGANPNLKDEHGYTALHWAIQFHRSSNIIPELVIPELLAYGADPNLPDKKGETPLMLAQREERPDLMTLLERGGGR